MAKYVLLAFDTDDAADEFVAGVQADGDVGVYGQHRENSNWYWKPFSTIVRGVWKKPTQFCTCIGGGKQDHGYTRGRKYGWWVHFKCKKPKEAWAKGDAWYVALGTNLLPISQHAPEYRGPDHKRHDGYGGD